MTKVLIWIVILGLVVAGGILLFGQQGRVALDSDVNEDDSTSMKVPAPGSEGVDEMIINGDNLPPATAPDAMIEEKIHTVRMTDGGFEPKELAIKQGDVVVWVNESSRKIWPASANHPTHTVYPTSGGCLGSTFDACKGLESGEEFSFQFNEVGEWGYHDHLRASVWGKIIVE